MTGPLSYARARSLTFAGAHALADAGYHCTILNENFSHSIVRIKRKCHGPSGVRLRYTTLS